MTNVLVDDEDLRGEPIEPTDGDDVVDAPEHHVCEEQDGDSICGASFPTANALRMHKMGKHRDRSKDGAPKPRKAAAQKKPTRRKSPAAKAADTATGSTTNRSMEYAASIAFFAMAAYVAIPPFDEYDLNVVNQGAPNLASALDDVGEQNQTVRAACDMILGGGAGGAYLKLVMAMGSIVMPIAAHHGAIPGAAGARLGEFVGVVPDSPPVAETPDEGGGSGATPYDPSNIDDVLAFMSGVPPTVMTDAAQRMMSGVGPTVVNVPPSVSATMQGAPQDGERGSEQPNPEVVAVP